MAVATSAIAAGAVSGAFAEDSYVPVALLTPGKYFGFEVGEQRTYRGDLGGESVKCSVKLESVEKSPAQGTLFHFVSRVEMPGPNGDEVYIKELTTNAEGAPIALRSMDRFDGKTRSTDVSFSSAGAKMYRKGKLVSTILPSRSIKDRISRKTGFVALDFFDPATLLMPTYYALRERKRTTQLTCFLLDAPGESVYASLLVKRRKSDTLRSRGSGKSVRATWYALSVRPTPQVLRKWGENWDMDALVQEGRAAPLDLWKLLVDRAGMVYAFSFNPWIFGDSDKETGKRPVLMRLSAVRHAERRGSGEK